MKVLVALGKLITLFAWLIMFYNLAMPFEGKIALLLNVLLMITCVMHAVQAFIFHSLFKQLMTLKLRDYLQVMLFGVFTLLEYRQRVLKQGQ